MEVTIIIPVHNSEKYIKECIQSVLYQTFNDIEILCIDGGSTDSSYEIISQFQKNDNRIVYIHDLNTSYGHKINKGINMANGKYVAILESDDKMCPEMIEKLYGAAKSYNADIVDGDFYEMYCHNGKEFKNSIRKYDNHFYGYLIKGFHFLNKDAVISGIWTALYKKEFIINNHIYLNESKGASYQDFSFVFLASILSKATYHVMSPLYQYRIDNVGSSVKDNNKVFEIIGECSFLKCELEKREIQNKEIWELYYKKKYEAFYWNYCRLSPQARELFLEKYLEELMDDIEKKHIKRKEDDLDIYKNTFLLLDNKKEFVNRVNERDGSLSLTKICNILDKCKDEKLVIFGAGIWGERIIKVLLQNDNKVQGICDNSKSLQGTVKNGFEIIGVEAAIEKFPDAIFLIANRKSKAEMRQQLLEKGIDERSILILE